MTMFLLIFVLSSLNQSNRWKYAETYGIVIVKQFIAIHQKSN